MGRFVFSATIAGAFLAAGVIGYFWNIFASLALAVLCFYLWAREVRKPNPYPGTSGKMGGIIITFILTMIFCGTLLATSFIVNRVLVAEFFKITAHYTSILLLR